MEKKKFPCVNERITFFGLNESFKVILCTVYILCRLSTSKISAEGFESLSSTLKSNAQLRELDLGNNRPGDQGVELLSAVLHDPNCRLKTLRLRYRNQSIVFDKVGKPSICYNEFLSQVGQMWNHREKLHCSGFSSPLKDLQSDRSGSEY